MIKFRELPKGHIEKQFVQAFVDEYQKRTHDGEEFISPEDVRDHAIDLIIKTYPTQGPVKKSVEFLMDILDEESMNDLVEDIKDAQNPYHNPLSDIGMSEKDFL